MATTKTCSNCQAENEAKAKFCYNCGTRLPEQSGNQKVCKNCGFENELTAKYCGSCGSSLSKKIHTAPTQQRTHRPKKSSKKAPQSKPGSLNPLYVVLVAFGAVLIFLYIESKNSRTAEAPQQIQPALEQKTNSVELENKVYAIAAKFVCSCGSCGEQPLESCTCPTAQQERQFIRENLLQDRSVADVITAVNTTYGWLKPEYKSEYAKGNLSLDLKSTPTNDVFPAPDKNTSKGVQLARLADREQIISHFACACGQCNIDELKDCNCNHPNGAVEVKRFIDDKIAEDAHTVEKVIALVEEKYGNRIR